LIGSDIALTCAHVIRDHLGSATPTPTGLPAGKITIRFEGIDREVSGHVLAKGWFPDSVQTPDGLSDIAVIRLDEEVQGVTIPAIARNIPNQQFDGFVFGAGPGYEGIGQEAQVKISGNANLRGWRKLDSGPIGFSVKRGFSGAPAMDELGNTVWGMIATVDAAGEKVSFAIIANDLRLALRLAGADSTTGVRISDELDLDGRQAMIALREQVAGMEVEFQQKQQEIARLQDLVRSFGERERSTAGIGAERRALKSLAEGDARPAVQILQARVRELRGEAAAASRQLGSLLSLNNSTEALAAYREAALLDPNDFWTLIEVGDRARSAGSLSRTAHAYQQAHEIAARLTKTDPGNAGWQREVGVGYDKIGGVHRTQGNLRGALDAYQKSLEIRARLAATDPGNPQWQRDLSMSASKIGDIRRVQGDLQGAFDAYQKSLEIATRLAETDPTNTEWQRDLSVCYGRIGEVRQARGDLQGALDAYNKSLEIAALLAETDPHNTESQTVLSFCYGRVGEVRQAQGDLRGALNAYDKSLEIAALLAETDPHNTMWESDLSISHDRIGDVRKAQGDLQGAFDAYQKSLEIATRLAETDPHNTTWQRDLSLSYDRIGDVRKAQGDLQGAFDAYQKSLEIATRLTETDPTNSQWQQDLVWIKARIEQAHRQLNGSSTAGNRRC
jgi:tetratricopeptide (TPR) repeat protein